MVQSYDTWQMIHLLIHKANTMLGIIEVFNSLHNYAFCLKHFFWCCRTHNVHPMTFAKQNRQEITWKLILWIKMFSLRKSANLLVCVFSSLPRHCYCGTCRVIIATFVPANSGPPFCMDAMRKSMGKYKMTQEMDCFTFETIDGPLVFAYKSIFFVAFIRL